MTIVIRRGIGWYTQVAKIQDTVRMYEVMWVTAYGEYVISYKGWDGDATWHYEDHKEVDRLLDVLLGPGDWLSK